MTLSPPPFVDIHCHLLPSLDDGASDWGQSLAMARMAVEDGTSVIVATPHQLGNYAENRGDAVRETVAALQRLLDQHAISLTVLPGADVRIEPDMIAKIQAGEVLTLADRRRHVLLELPHEVYLPLDRLLGSLRTAGLVGILSHPERNQGILAQPGLVEPLVDAGCLLQVTAGAITGTFGPQVQRLAQWLVERRLVHFVSTDAHGVNRRRPLMRRAFDSLCDLAGYETAVDWCCRNPAAVASGRDVAARSPRREGRRCFGWFSKRKAA